MNAYEARYKKQYTGFNLYGKADVSAETKLGQLIDSTWHHSWHWPKEIDTAWKESVTQDLNKEIDDAKKRIADLELARKILDQIEV